MLGDDIKAGVKGNRLLGDERVSCLGKPTGPMPQCLLRKLPLHSSFIGSTLQLMKFSFSHSMKWSIFIFVLTFILGSIFSVTSTTILEGVGWGIGILIVFFIICVGIVFDMMGIASTAAKETPFNAMAAERVRGSKHAIAVVRNADRFSSFCNDVIGDISGIISGAASAIVVLKLFKGSMYAEYSTVYTVTNVTFTALVSALTVGGKALGKSVAIHNSTQIVLMIGKFFYFLETRLGLRVFSRRKSKLSNGKRGNKSNASK